jgi:hypothetical protein
MKRKTKKSKLPKDRNVVALALIDRKGAGGGYHSKRGYNRRQKYRADWIEEDYDEWDEYYDEEY